MLPPYWTVTASATASPYTSPMTLRMSANLLGLVSGRGLAGADGPDGLVSDDHVLHLLGGHAAQSDLGLHPHQLLGHALLALGQALAHADDDLQARVQGSLGALVDGLVGLAKYWRRSLWPTMTYSTPRSVSMSALISPVKAPDFSKWTFSAPTWMLVPLVLPQR